MIRGEKIVWSMRFGRSFRIQDAYLTSQAGGTDGPFAVLVYEDLDNGGATGAQEDGYLTEALAGTRFTQVGVTLRAVGLDGHIAIIEHLCCNVNGEPGRISPLDTLILPG